MSETSGVQISTGSSEGDFENIVSLNFTSPCEIISKNGARLSFAKDSFMETYP